MLRKLKTNTANFLTSRLWRHCDSPTRTLLARDTHKALVARIAFLDEALSTRADCTNLTVSPHACERYMQRIQATVSESEARKVLYMGVLKAAASLDRVLDGKYSISKNVIAVVENQAVVTCYRKR